MNNLSYWITNTPDFGWVIAGVFLLGVAIRLLWKLFNWISNVNEPVPAVQRVEKYFLPGPDNIVTQIRDEVISALAQQKMAEVGSSTALTSSEEEIANQDVDDDSPESKQ